MSLFAKLFLESAALMVGITIIAQILGKLLIKDLPDEDYSETE
jgi:hypothetical protein